jgi:hypothetical protein
LKAFLGAPGKSFLKDEGNVDVPRATGGFIAGVKVIEMKQ